MNSNGIDGYRDFLVRRDGDADLLHRRLASREEFFAALEAEPIRSKHVVDRESFARNLRRRRPEPTVDRRMLFLLATAKLNQAERFGVGLGETYGQNSRDDVPPERVYMELEEPVITFREIRAIFRRLGFEPRFIGAVPPELRPKVKTQVLSQ